MQPIPSTAPKKESVHYLSELVVKLCNRDLRLSSAPEDITP